MVHVDVIVTGLVRGETTTNLIVVVATNFVRVTNKINNAGLDIQAQGAMITHGETSLDTVLFADTLDRRGQRLLQFLRDISHFVYSVI